MSDFIPEDFIQKVLEDSDIVSLVDSYVPLKRKGKDHWAQCPFCDDGSNPSFSVSDQKQFYYCFKCRASGNAIGFLMNYQSKDFVGAVEILAKNLGLEIPKTKSNYDREKFDELFRFNDEAKNFYKNNLLKPKEGEHIRSYLKERGISEEISKEFELGLSLEGWDNLVKHFESKKIEAKESSKLFKIAKNERKYDVFRNRLIFPITSRRNKIVGFGGRVLDDADQPKYLNTPESEVFKKSRELYGLPNVLVEAMSMKKVCIVSNLPSAKEIITHADNGFLVLAKRMTPLTEKVYEDNVTVIYETEPIPGNDSEFKETIKFKLTQPSPSVVSLIAEIFF